MVYQVHASKTVLSGTNVRARRKHVQPTPALRQVIRAMYPGNADSMIQTARITIR
eukprot:CAMPEP_0202891260 /NCGR_PEP_ID=MMETSP1392-20130828/1367_1 /ASSEMBLY_ACC=CAM_ASM_000868 /TAXON_ID=225041 /ORGANISM="Chlamydomonas chlamydogama, Strain SAG 11-48b" /LENGTH=54 /DNA_ID=CAMNT_0049574959 /DNA_START=174 /DNA_END=338 /DNA_ORIENTATION=-